LELDV
jgi:hypothetical protein